MGINVVDLTKYVIRPTLAALEPVAPGISGTQVEVLLLATAAQESQFERLRQIGGGPALGIWQMEPSTHDDIWANYLLYKTGNTEIDNAGGFATRIGSMVGRMFLPTKPFASYLVGNLPYACIMARLSYYRHSAPLPTLGLIDNIYAYYKQYYNSSSGAATQAEFTTNFNNLVAPHLPIA